MEFKKDDRKVLNKETINKITDVYYDHPDRSFTLKGFHIPIGINSYANRQQEKRLQWLAQRQMELLIGKSIEEENYQTELNDLTGGYILEGVLLDKIKEINENKINNYLNSENSNKTFEEVALIIMKDFISRFNAIKDLSDKNKNIQLHKLFFNEDKDLSIKINDFKIDYFVIDTADHRTNTITIIKEKKLQIRASHEYPDFAVYYNGLPFIVIEMKQLSLHGMSGTHEALKDYMSKESYHNFLTCIGTNSVEAFISGNPAYSDFFKWLNYKDLNGYVGNYNNEDENGFYDIIKELVVSPKNMLFYFETCTMVSECGTYLKNARIQQYMTAKKVYEKMVKTPEGFKNHFQHHTRTGKSFTFKIIAKLAYQKLNNRYKKVIFFTHDVSSVMPSVMREFKNLEFPSGEIKRINSKNEYKRLLSANTMFGLYIANMQIIEQSNEVIDNSNGVLIFVDEVHTHQKSTEGTIKKSTMADFRKTHFPKATIISATASPLYAEQKKKNGEVEYRNITSELHGECIDKLTPSDALKLDLVTKLNYEKVNYKSSGIVSLIQKLHNNEKEEEKVLINSLIEHIDNLMEKNQEEILLLNKIKASVIDKYNSLKITKKNYTKIEKLNPYNENTEEFESMAKLLKNLQLVVNKDIDLIRQKLKPKFRQKLWESTLREKIEFIVIPDILSQRREHNEFTPKFFYVVDPRDDQTEKTNGEKMLIILKDMIKDYISNNPNYDKKLFNLENNIYKGVRFGFDSSEEDKADYNGDLGGKSDITSLFEVDELENKGKTIIKPVDVLILVRKKLMGYDNKNLTTVFLDKEIDESNIKEMLQLSTRGTTKREGKDLGYIKDLTFSNRNINTFKKAFAIYDEKDGVKDFLFDDVEIIKLISEIEEQQEYLIDLISKEEDFKNKEKDKFLKDPIIIDIIEFVKKQYWLWRSNNNKQESEYFIEKYICLVSKIEKGYKGLISPQFILEKKDKLTLLEDILSIFQINAALLKDIKNKNATIYKRQYTSEDIVNILEASFQTFGGLTAFMDQIEIRYKGKSFVTIAESYKPANKKQRITDSISKIQKDLNTMRSSSLSGKFREELEEISIFVDSSSEDSVSSQDNKINALKKKVEEMKKVRQKRINEEFNGDYKLFEIVYNFEHDFKEEYYDCLISWAEELHIKIQKTINGLDISMNQRDKILGILKEVNFNRMPDSVNDMNDPLYKKFGAIYKRIFKNKEEKAIIEKEEFNLIQDLENHIPIEEIEAMNNKVLNILLRYLENE